MSRTRRVRRTLDGSLRALRAAGKLEDADDMLVGLARTLADEIDDEHTSAEHAHVVDGDHITVKTQAGDTTTIVASSSTKVTKTERGKVSDLKTGDTVTVTGTTASDGTATARAIREGDGGLGFGGFGRFSGAPPNA